MAIQSANVPTLITLDQWKGMNNQVPRGSIDDQELWWSENFFPVAPGNLRTMWGPSPPVYTVPSGLTILRIFFGNYGNDLPQYGQPPPSRKGWMFLSDGSIDEVDLDTKAVTRIGGGRPLWKDIPPKHWAAAKVWRPRWTGDVPGEIGGVLFGSPGGDMPGQLGGLVAYDGSTGGPHGDGTYVAGDPAPNWLTFADVTGAAWTTMPWGLPDIYCMEVFLSRLWVAGKDVLSFSAPTNATDFSDVDGGGSIAYSGNNLVYTYTDMMATEGNGPSLYLFGDSSTDMISNVQMYGQGTPSQPYTTVFTYSHVDTQIGHRYPRPAAAFGRYPIIANAGGIWQVFGGDNKDVSQKIKSLYYTVDTSNFYPTMAVANTTFGYRVLLVNGEFTDPFGVKRSMMLVWDGEKWTVASQGLDLTHIGQYEDNTALVPYGTDGTSLYQLFWLPSPTLPKRLSTKALRGSGENAFLTIKNWKRIYVEVTDNTGTGIPLLVPPVPETVPHGVSLIGTLTTAGGGIPNGVEDIGFELPVSGGSSGDRGWPPDFGRHGIIPQAVSGQGIYGAVDLQTLSPDASIERLHLAVEDRVLFGA